MKVSNVNCNKNAIEFPYSIFRKNATSVILMKTKIKNIVYESNLGFVDVDGLRKVTKYTSTKNF